MRCGKAQEWISLDLDDQLPNDRVLDLESHVDACAACRAYRDDLLVGQRMLQASTPELTEGFEWRLRLKMNQVLREAARQAPAPWEENEHGAGNWWRQFGVAVPVGLAAVLAVVLFILPPGSGDESGRPLIERPGIEGLMPVASSGVQAQDHGDRLPLNQRTLKSASGGRGWPRTVSNRFDFGNPRASGLLDSGFLGGWSGRRYSDLHTINSLRRENERLGSIMRDYQRQIRSLRAELDSDGNQPLDLHDNLPGHLSDDAPADLATDRQEQR